MSEEDTEDTGEHPTPWYYVRWSAALFIKTPTYELDPFATHENKKADRCFTIEDNGLIQPWKAESAFINPPYGMKEQPIDKAWEEVACGNCKIAVMLVRVPTIAAKWFQKFRKVAKHIVILDSGRITFEGHTDAAKFHSMIVVFEHGFKVRRGYNNIRFICCPAIGSPMPSPSMLDDGNVKATPSR